MTWSEQWLLGRRYIGARALCSRMSPGTAAAAAAGESGRVVHGDQDHLCDNKPTFGPRPARHRTGAPISRQMGLLRARVLLLAGPAFIELTRGPPMERRAPFSHWEGILALTDRFGPVPRHPLPGPLRRPPAVPAESPARDYCQ